MINQPSDQLDTLATKLSDGAQVVLPVALVIVDGVPVVGGVIKAVAGGLLYLLERIEASLPFSILPYSVYYVPHHRGAIRIKKSLKVFQQNSNKQCGMWKPSQPFELKHRK